MPEPGPLGIFGGTFDPVHGGHLRLAEEARDSLNLAQVQWIPAGQPPHRHAPNVTAQDRLAMVRLATQGNRAFRVDASEVLTDAPSYTVHTLERLRREEGDRRPLVLLVGADAFAGLPTWHRWESLWALAHIAIAHRPGFPITEASLPPALATQFAARRRDDPACLAHAPAGYMVTFAMAQLAISATQIRKLLANGASPRYLLPDPVLDYIRQHHLYQPA